MDTTIQLLAYEYFYALGNNCRLQNMTQVDAQQVIDNSAQCLNDSDDFWTGFFYGTDEEVVCLPSSTQLQR